MIHFLSTLPSSVSAHPHVAYLVVLLLAASESIPLVGVVVPGTAVIVAIAALVPRGDVGLWPLLAAASIGAVLSDGVSFWFGRHYQAGILRRWPFSRYPDAMKRSEAFFKRHGGKSVFLARFIPGIRAFIPITAGLLDMPVRMFYIVNVASALVWSIVHIVPGVFVGSYVMSAGLSEFDVALIAIAALVLAGIATHAFVYFRSLSRKRIES
jgi:undecaprenyl-diphosphatase